MFNSRCLTRRRLLKLSATAAAWSCNRSFATAAWSWGFAANWLALALHVALDLGEQCLDLVSMRLAARSWLFATTAWSCRCYIAANRSWCSALNNRSFATTAWSWFTAAVSVNLAVKLSEEAL